MKNLKKILRIELRTIHGGIGPKAGCLPCNIYCSLALENRPPCKTEYIVAHCNSCKGGETV